MSSTSDITKKAKSNLAFALRVLPKQQRLDMQTFYAFCRTVDDIADNGTASTAERRDALQQWKEGLVSGFTKPDTLQQELVALRRRMEIPNEHLTDIIDGCLMDLEIRRYKSWEDLEEYIWKVACTVGLVSIRLFGCQAPESEQYAICLAKALQLTNIMRDFSEDYFQRDRIYLPTQDLYQFGYSEEDLADRAMTRQFHDLMEFEAIRAKNWYEEAELSMTSFDHRALRPARIMADIYRDLLEQMRRDKFRVFDKRYQVPNRRKILILLNHLFG